MSKFALNPIDVEGLRVLMTPFDVRKDLHNFVAYCSERTIKRSTRTNELPKADVGRLTKMLSRLPTTKDFAPIDSTLWIDYIDRLALQMGFISYNLEREYINYNDESPASRSNYIVFKEEAYRAFLAAPLLSQERTLLETLVETTPNEFYQTATLGCLKPFSRVGSALGLMSTLKFPEIRRFLLNVLAQCQSGIWYSTASLVAYLRIYHDEFLIPKVLPKRNERWGRFTPGRYGNFYEGQLTWAHDQEVVPDDAPDGFERVEGRYVERFLEGIPLELGYVDVVYRPGIYTGLRPERDWLVAFRVHERFIHLMKGQLSSDRVIIQPNFEIHLESEFYPSGLIIQLSKLAKLVKEDRTIVFKLDKKMVAEAVAKDAGLDVGGLLRALSGRELPQNVAVEIEEWAGHAETFTLYQGFGLFESHDLPEQANPFILQSLAPNLHLVKEPKNLLNVLERAELVPMYVKHNEDALSRLPEKTQTIFPRHIAQPLPKHSAKEPLIFRRETWVTLLLANEEAYDMLCKALIENRTLFETNKNEQMIRYNSRYQSQVDKSIKILKGKYIIELEEQ